MHNFSWGPGGVLSDDNGGSVYTPGYARRQASADLFLHPDWISSTRSLSTSAGAFPNTLRFDAFGNRAATSGLPYDPIDFQSAAGAGYQTEYADSSTNEPGVGLQYLQQRYYDPVVGRFISPDPIGFSGGLNPYEYAGNDPVNLIDPLGTGPMRPLPGFEDADYRTDMTEHGGPDMHIEWPKGGGETLADSQGRVVITQHGGKETVPVPTDNKKRNAARKQIDKFRKKLGLPPCTDEDLNGVRVDNFQAILDAAFSGILPESILPPSGTSYPARGGKSWCTQLQPPSLDDLKQGGGWVVLYLIVSEGSRFLFPPRNLIPAW